MRFKGCFCIHLDLRLSIAAALAEEDVTAVDKDSKVSEVRLGSSCLLGKEGLPMLAIGKISMFSKCPEGREGRLIVCLI